MSDSVNLRTKGIDIAQNELITRSSVNRNVKKLIDNDKILYDQYVDAVQKSAICEYIPYRTSNSAYQYGDVVWFRDAKNTLWILKCIISDNQTDPGQAIDDLDSLGYPLFEKYGWQDLNKSLKLEDIDVDSYLRNEIQTIVIGHENDETKHKFGRLSMEQDNPDYIDGKILRSDLSNADPNRKLIHYPYVTGHFQDNTILNGLYRVWECGIIEFNIIFRLGFVGQDKYGKDIYECNNMDFKFNTASTRQKKDYQENSMYFMTEDDAKIFMPCENMKTYEHIDVNSIQRNRTKYVNTYFGTLNLFSNPIQFKDVFINKFSSLDYMIFSGDNVSCGNSDTKTVRCLDNQLSWCNKTPTSVTALLVTYPDVDNLEDFAKNGGLFSNSFGCHIIGKWK